MATGFQSELGRQTPLTIADLVSRFGPLPLWRICLEPAPGTATEADVIRLEQREGRLCELIDGILVEKPMGAEESELAVWIAVLLTNFVRPRKLGRVLGADGPVRLKGGLVRSPDVCFIAADRLPKGRLPTSAVLPIAPNLVVEVLSTSNTPREMQRKRREYFAAGVELVWQVDPRTKTVEVFTGPADSTTLDQSQLLRGGTVLSGFKVKVRDIFSVSDEA